VIVGRFALQIILLAGKLAGAGSFLQLGTGRFDEIEDDLVKSEWTTERMTGHNDTRTAMPFAPVIEGELDFGAYPKGPLGEKTHSLGRPVNLVLNQVN
jgi:hypothetical protein